eukprot:m.25254 g.25254  ORF g.25254 m.25254 type:complete len:278 (+) comp8688_c0_seq2:171-1004(+)
MDSDPFFRAAGKGKGKVAKRSSDARGGRGNGRGSSGRGGSKRADKAPSSASKYKSELSVQQLKQQEDDDFSDAGDIDMFNQSDDESDAEVVEETAAEKRLRMARELIQNMEDEVGDAVEGQPGDVVAQRLRDTLRASKGVLHQEFRARLQGKLPKEDLTVTTRGHRLPVTCVTISADGAFFVTGSKDKSVIKWNSQLGIKAFHWTAFGYHGRTNVSVLAHAYTPVVVFIQFHLCTHLHVALPHPLLGRQRIGCAFSCDMWCDVGAQRRGALCGHFKR